LDKAKSSEPLTRSVFLVMATKFDARHS
jgi:hypothetical protein